MVQFQKLTRNLFLKLHRHLIFTARSISRKSELSKNMVKYISIQKWVQLNTELQYTGNWPAATWQPHHCVVAQQYSPPTFISLHFHSRKEESCTYLKNVNLLKPTGYVMHQQFNIQQLYVLPTLYLCVLYLSENKQRLVPLTA